MCLIYRLCVCSIKHLLVHRECVCFFFARRSHLWWLLHLNNQVERAIVECDFFSALHSNAAITQKSKSSVKWDRERKSAKPSAKPHTMKIYCEVFAGLFGSGLVDLYICIEHTKCERRFLNWDNREKDWVDNELFYSGIGRLQKKKNCAVLYNCDLLSSIRKM